tara:strand:+ start:1747 stop:1917 length:171 start_codon:yes stop_codon:yes gene_type:complete
VAQDKTLAAPLATSKKILLKLQTNKAFFSKTISATNKQPIFLNQMHNQERPKRRRL